MRVFVTIATDIEKRGRNCFPPPKLKAYHIAGGFDEEHFALLSKNKRLINPLAHQILQAHFPKSIQGKVVVS